MHRPAVIWTHISLLAVLLGALPAAQAQMRASSARLGSTEAALVAVAAEADAPPAQEALKPFCAQQTEGGVISFVTSGTDKVVLVALSAQPLADVQRDIWLSPRFARAGEDAQATGTQDWAYIYDGNGDGQIDHMAFLIGPLPTEPRTAGKGLPNISGDQVRIKNPAMLDEILKAMRFGFWQVRDEDGDGVPDSMAMPARRKENGWYRGWAIFDRRATSEDASCRFIDRDGRPAGGCRAAQESGAYENNRLSTHVWVRDPGPIFSAILDAAKACKIQPSQLRPVPALRP